MKVQTMKAIYLAVPVLLFLLSSCSPTKVAVAPDDAYKLDCPGSSDVFLSVEFDKDKNPVGIGGGEPVDPRVPNEKFAKQGNNICWVAVNSDGSRSDIKFAILFAPDNNPNPTNDWQNLNVNDRAPVGLAYKYSVWSEFSDINKPDSYLDPRIVIHN
jgi:hypothetical protein